MARYIEFLYNTFISIRDIGVDIINWLSTEYSFFGTTLVVGEVLFGTGLIVFLGLVIINWIVPG